MFYVAHIPTLPYAYLHDLCAHTTQMILSFKLWLDSLLSILESLPSCCQNFWIRYMHNSLTREALVECYLSLKPFLCTIPKVLIHLPKQQSFFSLRSDKLLLLLLLFFRVNLNTIFSLCHTISPISTRSLLLSSVALN